MAEHKFFICRHCGNIVGMIQSAGVPIVCCGSNMEELVANTVDAAQEKHVPVVSVSGNTVSVKVGSVPHPMTEEHLISWIYLETEKGGQRRQLTPSDAAEATFIVADDDKPIAVYEYCNLHGLWKTNI